MKARSRMTQRLYNKIQKSADWNSSSKLQLPSDQPADTTTDSCPGRITVSHDSVPQPESMKMTLPLSDELRSYFRDCFEPDPIRVCNSQHNNNSFNTSIIATEDCDQVDSNTFDLLQLFVDRNFPDDSNITCPF
jgi:hypothetical protein